MTAGSAAGQSSSDPPSLVIDSSEALARICFEGDAVNVVEARLKAEGISRDDLTTRGFSLQRRRYLTPAILVALQERRTATGFFPLQSVPVLNVKDEQGQQALEFCFDSIDGLNRAHTMIKLKRHYSRSHVSAIRKDLADCLGSLIAISQIMESSGA